MLLLLYYAFLCILGATPLHNDVMANIRIMEETSYSIYSLFCDSPLSYEKLASDNKMVVMAINGRLSLALKLDRRKLASALSPAQLNAAV